MISLHERGFFVGKDQDMYAIMLLHRLLPKPFVVYQGTRDRGLDVLFSFGPILSGSVASRIVEQFNEQDYTVDSTHVMAFLDSLCIDYSRTTDLCEIMARYGSDKGHPAKIGRHNYTIFYKEIFEPIRHSARAVFELGLGTNNT